MKPIVTSIGIFSLTPRSLAVVTVFFVLSLLIPFHSCFARSKVRVKKTKAGWQLLVDKKPYIVKGMCYWPAKVGESADEATLEDWMTADEDNDGRIDAPYQSWVDANKNNKQDADEPTVGDFQLLKDLGCNTIRVYHHASLNPAVMALNAQSDSSKRLYNHAPNKELLRDLYKTYGIRVAMGDLLGAYTVGSGADWTVGTDYTDPVQRRNMMKSVEAMVREFKDEPFLLMWVLGNENTNEAAVHTNAQKNPEAYGKFVNEVARRIHRIDGRHPVTLCEFDGSRLRAFAKLIPHVDIYGVNSYRIFGFGSLWEVLDRTYNKPILITEYGISRPKFINGQLDETYHAKVYEEGWLDIAAHAPGGDKNPSNSIGGFVFEWLDNWWQDGDPWEHYSGLNWNHEICGLATQGNGESSPFLRSFRKTYFSLQNHWTKTGPPPETPPALPSPAAELQTEK